MNWLRKIFATRNRDHNNESRKEALQQLEAIGFYKYPDDCAPHCFWDSIIKSGGTVFELLGGSGRMFSALYKEEQDKPWIKELLADMVDILRKQGIHLAIRRELEPCTMFNPKTGESTEVMKPSGPMMDIEPTDPQMLQVRETYARDEYKIGVGAKEWIIWNRETPSQDRALLERQRLLDIVNQLLEEKKSDERLWHCWGEKGGESLFIFLTIDQHKIIEESHIIYDEITPTMTESPWGPLE